MLAGTVVVRERRLKIPSSLARPDVELTLQVSIPLLDVTAEPADLEVLIEGIRLFREAAGSTRSGLCESN